MHVQHLATDYTKLHTVTVGDCEEAIQYQRTHTVVQRCNYQSLTINSHLIIRVSFSDSYIELKSRYFNTTIADNMGLYPGTKKLLSTADFSNIREHGLIAGYKLTNNSFEIIAVA